MLHGAGIFTYMNGLNLMVKVGKYTIVTFGASGTFPLLHHQIGSTGSIFVRVTEFFELIFCWDIVGQQVRYVWSDL